MSDELELYQRGLYRADRALIEEVKARSGEVASVLFDTFDAESGTWPYAVSSGQSGTTATPFSFSTSAMILFALGVASGQIQGSALVPTAARVPGLATDSPEFRSISRKAIDSLVEESKKVLGRSTAFTESGTFGNDDPFTFTWLIELLAADHGSLHAGYLKELTDAAEVRVRDVLASEDPLRSALNIDPGEQVPHAFPLLRILQLGAVVSKRSGKPIEHVFDLSHAREVLLQQIHYHLSQAEILDGDSDAADLVFALEGWILASPFPPNAAVVDRAFQVLTQSQRRAPYWRPLRPFKATPQGLVLLPLSVEIANSLLRICDSKSLADREYFSIHGDLVREYARWLMARALRGSYITAAGEESRFVGWESEHTYALNRIHLWQTSQALLFLQHLGAMLQRHVARTSLRLAGFGPPPTSGRTTLAQGSDTLPEEWAGAEPLASLPGGSAYRVYEHIWSDFVLPRRHPSESDQGSFSMLLYGPPGTGKTMIADRLAKALGFHLITVTPSDFIAEGGDAVEARAKAIFDVLKEQDGLVVLFDEIDSLLLDRDSGFYQDQGDVFRLLTPGMLTKLNDLAKARRVIVVIATNYYERIDKAIKRPGRIDKRYLVLPPDQKGRKVQLERFVRDKFGGEVWASIPDETVEKLSTATVRFIYKELDDLVTDVRRANPSATGPELGDALLAAAIQRLPTIRLGGYESRFTDSKSAEPPSEEFALLAYLEIEAHGKLPSENLVTRLREVLDSDVVFEPAVKKKLTEATLGPRKRLATRSKRSPDGS